MVNLSLFLIVILKFCVINSERISVSINDVESEDMYSENTFAIEHNIYETSLNRSSPYPPPRVN